MEKDELCIGRGGGGGGLHWGSEVVKEAEGGVEEGRGVEEGGGELEDFNSLFLFCDFFFFFGNSDFI